MAKLKLGAIADDKPVKLTIELPAAVHRDLVAYAEALGRETGQPVSRARQADRADAGALHRRRPRLRQNAECQEAVSGAAGTGWREDIDRARLRKRRNAGLSLPGNHTALYGNTSSAVARGRKTTSG